MLQFSDRLLAENIQLQKIVTSVKVVAFEEQITALLVPEHPSCKSLFSPLVMKMVIYVGRGKLLYKSSYK